ncbi:hypothetical protein FQN57_003126 [Myotisia sp. PD_48]|nr:hypothetical protein FQN57_003126 [Myotisia sp. PD_48]
MAAPYVVPALTRHTATVIMAHGLGDSGAGWMMIAQNWRRRGLFNEVSFVFPNAPSIPISINMGMSMPGWFDVKTLSPALSMEEFLERQDEPGILKSRDYFNTLIKAEIDKGVKPSRIVFGGFSQGGAMALFSGLTSKEKLGGIYALSCWLPLANKIKDYLTEDWPNKKTPIFQAHGDEDMVVKFGFGEHSAEFMKELGCDVDFRKYNGLGHSGDPLEMEDLKNFLGRLLPDEGGEASTASS